MNVLFYVKRNLHVPHLEPIRRWLAANHPEHHYVYSSPPFTPSIEGVAGQGLPESSVKNLIAEGAEWIRQERIQDYAPDVTVMADADFGGIDWRGGIVNVNHGLICKGTFYTESAVVQRENGADAICVPGHYHAEILAKRIRREIVVTGLVKMDPFFRGEMTRENQRSRMGIPTDEHVILFAPTYNLELSSVPVLTTQIRQLAAGSVHLLIKLHGMSPPAWVEMYRLLAKLDKNVHFVEEQDITPSLVAADMVISDVSSAFMEAIILDRPVILVNSPLQKHFVHYDPEDIEYRMRDVGIEVSSSNELFEAVQRTFNQPDEKKPERERYGKLMGGYFDGRAAERASEVVLRIGASISPQRY